MSLSTYNTTVKERCTADAGGTYNTQEVLTYATPSLLMRISRSLIRNSGTSLRNIRRAARLIALCFKRPVVPVISYSFRWRNTWSTTRASSYNRSMDLSGQVYERKGV